jgi:ADP-ribosylation factor related protein 1
MQTFLEKLKSIYLKGEGLPHDRIVPAVGLNIGRIEDANVKHVFWDLGGQVWFLLQSYIDSSLTILSLKLLYSSLFCD